MSIRKSVLRRGTFSASSQVIELVLKNVIVNGLNKLFSLGPYVL